MSTCIFMLDPLVFKEMNDNELSDRIDAYKQRIKEETPDKNYGYKAANFRTLLINYRRALVEQKFRTTHLFDAGGTYDMSQETQIKIKLAYCYGFVSAKLEST